MDIAHDDSEIPEEEQPETIVSISATFGGISNGGGLPGNPIFAEQFQPKTAVECTRRSIGCARYIEAQTASQAV